MIHDDKHPRHMSAVNRRPSDLSLDHHGGNTTPLIQKWFIPRPPRRQYYTTDSEVIYPSTTTAAILHHWFRSDLSLDHHGGNTTPLIQKWFIPRPPRRQYYTTDSEVIYPSTTTAAILHHWFRSDLSLDHHGGNTTPLIQKWFLVINRDASFYMHRSDFYVAAISGTINQVINLLIVLDGWFCWFWYRKHNLMINHQIYQRNSRLFDKIMGQ